MTNQNFILKIVLFTAACFALSFSFSLLAEDEEKQGYPLSVIAKYKVLFEGPTYKIDQEKVWGPEDLAQTQVLMIKTVATDIEILPSLNNELRVTVQGKFSRSNILQVSTQNDQFIIDLTKQEKEQQNSFRITSDSGEIKIYVPASMQKLEVMSVSGDIEIKNQNFASLDIKTVSGEIEIESNAKDIKLKTISGDMELELPSSEIMLDIKTTSGDAEIKFTHGQLNAEVVFGSISGDLEVESEQSKVKNKYGKKFSGTLGTGGGKFQLQSVSGDFEIKF